ncbi:hypothetical protein ACWJJH_01320 [Endozoicomonadaceae bacterium StTr2]
MCTVHCIVRYKLAISLLIILTFCNHTSCLAQGRDGAELYPGTLIEQIKALGLDISKVDEITVFEFNRHCIRTLLGLIYSNYIHHRPEETSDSPAATPSVPESETQHFSTFSKQHPLTRSFTVTFDQLAQAAFPREPDSHIRLGLMAALLQAYINHWPDSDLRFYGSPTESAKVIKAFLELQDDHLNNKKAIQHLTQQLITEYGGAFQNTWGLGSAVLPCEAHLNIFEHLQSCFLGQPTKHMNAQIDTVKEQFTVGLQSWQGVHIEEGIFFRGFIEHLTEIVILENSGVNHTYLPIDAACFFRHRMCEWPKRSWHSFVESLQGSILVGDRTQRRVIATALVVQTLYDLALGHIWYKQGAYDLLKTFMYSANIPESSYLPVFQLTGYDVYTASEEPDKSPFFTTTSTGPSEWSNWLTPSAQHIFRASSYQIGVITTVQEGREVRTQYVHEGVVIEEVITEYVPAEEAATVKVAQPAF